MGGKKNPEPKWIGPEDYPFLSIGFCGLPTVHEGETADAQAGLLTLGSFYFPRLPIFGIRQWRVAAFVPDHSGGPVPY